MVPAESKMANIYSKLFVDEDQVSAERTVRQIGYGKRMTDLMRRQAETLQPSLSDSDRNKLEEYFESVEETRRRLVKSENWVHTPEAQNRYPDARRSRVRCRDHHTDAERV